MVTCGDEARTVKVMGETGGGEEVCCGRQGNMLRYEVQFLGNGFCDGEIGAQGFYSRRQSWWD